MFSCESPKHFYQFFDLSEFGIQSNNRFSINSGKVAFYNTLGGEHLQFNIYSADSNRRLNKSNYIGSSQVMVIPEIGENPEILNLQFDKPIVIPGDVQHIAVEVYVSYDINKPLQSIIHIAGTENGNDLSYYLGCANDNNLSNSVHESANFFIKVSGEILSDEGLGFPVLLTHTSCSEAVKVNQYSCSWGGLKYARRFILDDFGISKNEEFIIDKGQVGIANAGSWDAKIQFNIYKIDDNFPQSYSKTDLIGSSQIINIPYFGSGPNVARIFEIYFGEPIVVPADVDKILVEVYNVPSTSSSGLIFIAGGTSNNDTSWLRSESSGCPPVQEYKEITNSDINYLINITGRPKHTSNNFEMNISNNCSEFLKEFRVENKNNISSIHWDFGDPNSGVNNTSTDLSPFHDFSEDGIYTIKATVTALNNNVVTLTKTIDVREPPKAYGIDNLQECEDKLNSGISSNFDTSAISNQVLGGQLNKTVIFIDGSGNEYETLPNPFTNTIAQRETIKVRVAHSDEPCCYSETSFDLIVSSIPEINQVSNMYACDDDFDGITEFNTGGIKDLILNGQSGMEIHFFYENGEQLPKPLPLLISNKTPNQETITALVTNTTTNCSITTTFELIVTPLPKVPQVLTLQSCDDNNDGISEYFDTSNIESLILNGQTGMTVDYYNQNGNKLPNPLPNPYVNSIQFNETITARITNNNSGCFSETKIQLQTVTQPNINKPDNLYTCNLGSGYGQFDTSLVEEQLIGNQSGLIIQYYDDNNTPLPSPLPITLQNTVPFAQTIHVKVEYASNPICFSETSFDLIINQLPEINLKDEYVICNLTPSISLETHSGYNSYKWLNEENKVISHTYKAEISEEGSYSVVVTQINKGITCDNTFNFNLVRSELPKIQKVNFGELGNNYIEIITSGDGNLEYSIDGSTYQESNYFPNLQGGIYSVFIKDKAGCGEDFQEVSIIDYPKFFTPNNDGYNDFWHIKGIRNSPNSEVFIFNRFGMLLTRLSSNDLGWDGIYKGKAMPSNDYWFRVNLGNSKSFSGHFTLKR
ncbi:T9SS type B sorting domain-containing protein [Tamlana sp. s12]|nr:T9SS type B sorting domain-containing protein [Tamlana sp. s12]